ncbi:hypothetical protein MMC19_002363 [Ptychographa xylographoides]|nr:hypothetical protein [Ptychographa xylographoides]
MGFIPSDSESDSEEAPNPDEESQLITKRSPSLPTKFGNGYRNGKRISFSNSMKRPHRISSTPITPSNAANDDLFISTRARRSTMAVAEADEIWEELEEERPTPVSSPFRQRVSSARSTPMLGIGGRPSSARSHQGEMAAADETTGLLARAATGRSYRDRRRPRSAPLTVPPVERRRTEDAQEALGGWWKMRWWRNKTEDREHEGGRTSEDS